MNNPKKIVLVISDLHLGAGSIVNGKKNLLEDFHYDKELIDFIDYYILKSHDETSIELVINGDFLDLLAVPFVKYFDDEFWSEKAALEKLKMIMDAHIPVWNALSRFLEKPKNKIVYILGNHDAEMVFDSLKNLFLSYIKEAVRSKLQIDNQNVLYNPLPGVFIQHGHEYENAHIYDPTNVVIETTSGEKYFTPPWGSYYVTHVINKYKREREHINAVRPIKNFLIHGLIFDTFFTIRFMLANVYYFFMVRFMYFFRMKKTYRDLITSVSNELRLFQDYESLTEDFFNKQVDCRVLIVGHTHKPVLTEHIGGKKFINTGTWTRMLGLDLSFDSFGTYLTFARIESQNEDFPIEEFEKNVFIELSRWVGRNEHPFQEFR
jgi:UDP-2,3-diacylglucosamine pyrophosphatase LpxH